jgi:hypothetical protein
LDGLAGLKQKPERRLSGSIRASSLRAGGSRGFSDNAARIFWHSRTGPQYDAGELAIEEPLGIQVDTKPVCITTRTPGHDEELDFQSAVSRASSQASS